MRLARYARRHTTVVRVSRWTDALQVISAMKVSTLFQIPQSASAQWDSIAEKVP
jgi:hypothetical protein